MSEFDNLGDEIAKRVKGSGDPVKNAAKKVGKFAVGGAVAGALIFGAAQNADAEVPNLEFSQSALYGGNKKQNTEIIKEDFQKLLSQRNQVLDLCKDTLNRTDRVRGLSREDETVLLKIIADLEFVDMNDKDDLKIDTTHGGTAISSHHKLPVVVSEAVTRAMGNLFNTRQKGFNEYRLLSELIWSNAGHDIYNVREILSEPQTFGGGLLYDKEFLQGLQDQLNSGKKPNERQERLDNGSAITIAKTRLINLTSAPLREVVTDLIQHFEDSKEFKVRSEIAEARGEIDEGVTRYIERQPSADALVAKRKLELKIAQDNLESAESDKQYYDEFVDEHSK